MRFMWVLTALAGFLAVPTAQAATIDYTVSSPELSFHISINRDFALGRGTTQDGLTLVSYTGPGAPEFVYQFRPRTDQSHSRLIIGAAHANDRNMVVMNGAPEVAIFAAESTGAFIGFARAPVLGDAWAPTLQVTDDLISLAPPPDLRPELANFNLPLPGGVWLLGPVLGGLLILRRRPA